ncbi:MAG: hypothetical protein AAFQ27_10535 [Pseudomonadota bacterium]
MLSKGDDFPVHQTPEPIAYPGSDRNFYDRYFFNGYSPDGETFFAAAFGVYPVLDVVDAHFCVVCDGIQYCLHASRRLGAERMELSCGGIAIEILEPLNRLRLLVEGEGLAADITFEGRAFPIEEPRFTWRRGPRVIMDYTRMTQNGRYSGWISVDNEKVELDSGTVGTRDRSWGLRPVGKPGPQQPQVVPQFFWQWTPINLPDRSVFFHLNAHPDGSAWNTRAVIAPDGSNGNDHKETHDAELSSTLIAGSRWPSNSQLRIGEEQFSLEPIARFQMRGLGYTSPIWGHGLDHGDLEVEREDIDLSEIDPARPDNLHVQMLCRVTDNAGSSGLGVFEQLAIGEYAPLGLTGLAAPG